MDIRLALRIHQAFLERAGDDQEARPVEGLGDRRQLLHDLAQASYLIGCQAKGEAIVVDPRRDLDVYLRLAEKNGMRIAAVTETHIHADYLSGTRELAAKTGAPIYVSDEGGPDWTYGSAFDEAVRMKHGHKIQLGNIAVEAIPPATRRST